MSFPTAPPLRPFTITGPLRAQRLSLRLMQPTDVDDVLVYQSDPQVARYTLHDVRTRDEVVERLQKWGSATTLATIGDYLLLAIELDRPGADGRRPVIGGIDLSITSAADLTAEVGWELNPAFTGHGYATEAARLMIDTVFAQCGLHRVYAELDPRNDASARVCRRLGMRQEALIADHMWSKGEWTDTAIYGVLDREWNAHR